MTTRRAALVALVFLVMACGPSTAEDGLSQTDKTKLEITETRAGTGTEARAGRTVSVHYTGWLYHPTSEGHRGRKFDSSRDRGQTLEFTLGAREVIPGWDQGVAGMKVGGTRTLVIPAALAYGRQGAPGAIPPNATLVFDVELVGVR